MDARKLNKPDTILFIWVRGMRGPTCEILYGKEQNKDSHDRDKKQILQEHELPEELKDLNLNQLSMIYPYKELRNEASSSNHSS